MNPIVLPKSYNYIGVFLTYACNYQCPWCINKAGQLVKTPLLSADDWIAGLNRIESGDVPLTIGGGEPTVHPDFYRIVNGVQKPMDLLTNGNWNTQAFMRQVKPEKFKRDAPYASIRFSYHPGVTPLFKLLEKCQTMRKAGYSVGVWAIAHPQHMDDVMFSKRIAEKCGIDFRLKEYLGEYRGKLYGTYQYPEMLKAKEKVYECKPSELLVGPNGNVYRCHQHLYSDTYSYGNICGDVMPPSDYLRCETKEACSPCDIKGPKLDRFQKPGHCSVQIREAL